MRFRRLTLLALTALGFPCAAQSPTPQPPPAQTRLSTPQPSAQTPLSAPPAEAASNADQPTPAPAQPAPSVASPQSAGESSIDNTGIIEDELRSLLIGKQLFLRGGYLDNTLNFNDHGTVIGRSSQGSFTLCGIEIHKVRLAKHKLELEGTRYGLHFLGASPFEDLTNAVDRVDITPKKKAVRITVDRELVVKPKREKSGKGSSAPPPKAAPQAPPTTTPSAPAESSSASDQRRPTATTSPAHADKALKDALDNIFAQGFDSRMMASLPVFWKLYFEASASRSGFRPNDPAIQRESIVDKKAQLLATFEPQSNQYAQDHSVAGISIYRVLIDAQGKPAEIAVARPIGFGLDENAVDSIRKAAFSPAIKDGKPVPVVLDLVVQFRIYSKRTALPSPSAPDEAAMPSLPGPYSIRH